MAYHTRSQHLKILENKINITRSPFSDRGSRLLVFKQELGDRLDIHLAERLMALEPVLDVHRDRLPYIQDFCFIDESGNLLDFELISYPHVLFFETSLGSFALSFHDEDTLVVGLPDNVRAGVSFMLNSPIHACNERGGSFNTTHNLSFQTTCHLSAREIDCSSNGYQIKLVFTSEEDDALHLAIHRLPGWPVKAVPFSRTLKKAEQRWSQWFSKTPPVDERFLETYTYAWWVLANNLVSPLGHLKFKALMPSKAFYIGVWNWDACFHAVALRHVDPELARNQLRLILAWQQPDGMLPDAIHDEGLVTWINHPHPGVVTKPPVIAWAALKIHEIDPDLEFLSEIYPMLKRWSVWWFSPGNEGLDGLSQYTHPYSSGLDDNPLWDHGFPVTSPDLNTYLYIQHKSLAAIATLLGYEEDQAMWAGKSVELLRKMVDVLYDEDKGLFLAMQNETPVPEVTPFNLYPLWCDQLPEDIQQRLLAHLTDPDQFWTEYPLATVSRNTSSFSPECMWRGSVWININYIFVEALSLNGYIELAKELRERTLSLVAKNDGIYEYYNPLTGEVPQKAAPIFSWSAALYIDLALQASHP